MGNQQSTQHQTQGYDLQRFLKPNKHFSTALLKQLNYQKGMQLLESLKIIGHKSQHGSNNSPSKIFIHTLQFNDDFTFQKTLNRLSSRIESSNPHIFNLTNYKIQQQKHLCSMSRKMHLCQQGYDFTLKDLMNQKMNRKQSFSEQEVTMIMSKIVQTVIWMNDNQFRNVMIDAEAVVFVKNSGDVEGFQDHTLDNYQCKIIDQDIVQATAYKRFLQNLISKRVSINNQTPIQTPLPTLQIYLSPQLLEQASQQNFYPTNISLKSDIFTLGMLMMQICCQQEMYFCYNIDTMTLDYESLIHRIAKISYSNDFKLLLAEMLEYDENNRIGFVSLKEKLQKMMIKPFDETRRLKRRSSSTMLKELLSCSRASNSVQNNSKPTNKIGQSSRISTISRSVGKRDEDETSSKIEVKNQVATQSMRKSNSLVNLKCKTNSFLTSKKLTLMRNPSNTKLETEVKRVAQKEFNCDTEKVDYSKILRNRIKTQSKGLECPQGDQKLQESKISQFMKHEEINQNVSKQSPQPQNHHRESNARQSQFKPFETIITDRSIQENEKVFCGKINQGMKQEQNANENKSSQKEKQKQNIHSISKFTHSFVQKKVINLDKINLNSSQSQKLHKSKSFNTNIPLNDSKENHQLNMNKQDKPFSLENKSRVKESTIQKTICLKNNSSSSKLIVKQCEKVQNKEVDVSSKSWIIGKLKNKNFLTKKPAESLSLVTGKDKSSTKKKETSLTKVKTISLPFQQIKQSAQKSPILQKETQPLIVDINLFTERSQQNSARLSTVRNNDTIIRGLQLTGEKTYLNEFDHQRQEDENSTIIQSSIKNQMEMVQKAMEKCALSSSRWQEDEVKDQSFTRHDNFVKYAEIKEKISSKSISEAVPKSSQFKKKSKVIDIDLGKISSSKVINSKGQNQSNNLKEKSSTKDEKKTSSKLQKLKQLTIVTDEDTITEDNNNNNQQITSKMQKNEPYNDDKQNNMQNSNRQALGQSDIEKLNGAVQNITKSKYLNSNYQPQSLNYLQIPYQRIEYVNSVATTSLMTPSNMNDLNKVYGNGMTVESMGQSLHRKEYSTLSKPFQEIELDFGGNNGSEITSPHLAKQNDDENFKNQFKKHPTISKDNEMFSINNSEELTFRVKSKPHLHDQVKGKSSYFKETFHPNPQSQFQPQSEVQKVNYFQKNDGSFVMRQQNPIKSIQTSSIIGQDKNKLLMPRNTVQELFKESTSKFNNKQFQSLYQGYKESFYAQDDECMKKSEIMDSSCNSINLSEIQHTAQKGESFLFPSSQQQKQKQKIPSPKKQRKLKHISILQPCDQPNDRSRDLSINLKNIKQQNDLQSIQSKRESEYNTYRRYLSSNNQFISRVIELDDNFVYEGEVNSYGEFQGNGMISRRDYDRCEDVLIYTGSFVNGRYHGFGTLYEIENAEDKIIKLPNKRISFGRPSNGLHNDKYFSLSQRPIKYEGEFCDGMQSGFGTYFYQNGDKFSGCIKNGKIEGYGTYNFVGNDEVISGIWRNNAYTDC